jgi:hypothetical protein
MRDRQMRSLTVYERHLTYGQAFSLLLLATGPIGLAMSEANSRQTSRDVTQSLWEDTWLDC